MQVANAVPSVAAYSGASFTWGVMSMVSDAGAQMYVDKAPSSGFPGFEPGVTPATAEPRARSVSISGATSTTVPVKLQPTTSPGVGTRCRAFSR